MKKSFFISSLALIFTFAVPVLGYFTLGIGPALIFLVGFLGGFILWLLIPMHATWQSIKTPYLATLFLFIIHRIDEQISGFFPALEEITGMPTPDPLSPASIFLVVFSLFWLLSPLLIKRGFAFGYYGAWSFFYAMGISELAHFIFPFFTPEPYGYFPGMATVIPLTPAAWWGLYRLSKKSD